MAHALHLNAFTLPGQDSGLFARLSRALADHREYRRIHDELNALSDRDLADIRLSRHNVGDVARKAVYGN